MFFFNKFCNLVCWGNLFCELLKFVYIRYVFKNFESNCLIKLNNFYFFILCVINYIICLFFSGFFRCFMGMISIIFLLNFKILWNIFKLRVVKVMDDRNNIIVKIKSNIKRRV